MLINATFAKMGGKLLFIGLLALSISKCDAADRIWSIAIGHDWGGHEYFDNKGYLQGFGLNLIDLVCQSGNMECRVVWDRYDRCWDSGAAGEHPSAGVGLMSSWYDACTGWAPSVERIHTLAFSMPYLKRANVFFYVLNGNSRFDPSDIRNKRVVFLDGWASSPGCIAREDSIMGRVMDPSQIVIVSNPIDAVNALENNIADAVFAAPDAWTTEHLSQIRRLNKPVSCFLGGNSMMTRKDNEFVQYWNQGFQRLREGNRFNEFCEETNKEHEKVGRVDCITW